MNSNEDIRKKEKGRKIKGRTNKITYILAAIYPRLPNLEQHGSFYLVNV